MHRDLIIIRRPPAYAHLIQAGMALLLLFAGFWFGYGLTPDAPVHTGSAVPRTSAQERELSELKDRYAALERSYQVEHASAQQSQHSLSQLEADKYQLEKEIALYRAILNPDKAVKPELTVASADVFADEDKGFRFRVTLLYPRADNRTLKGELGLLLVGKTAAGATKSLNLAELAELPASALKFQFQHFHYVDGRFRLPEDFRPEKLVVSLRPAERGAKRQSKEFPWQVR